MRTAEQKAEYQRRYRAENKERIRELRILWETKNAENRREYNRLYRFRNQDTLKEYDRNRSNKDERREKNRIRVAKDPKKNSENCRRWSAEHPDQKRQIYRRWYVENAESARAYARRWAAANPGRRRTTEFRRRARKAAAIVEPIRANFYALALIAWDHRCAYCRCDLRSAGVRTEWDHFRPIARGGAEAEYNYVPACRSCNASKHARDPFAFLFDIKYVSNVSRIFENPADEKSVELGRSP